MLKNMSTAEDCECTSSLCANCGKEGSNLKACTACKMVKYCNRDCQIAHRPQHKKECRRRAAELHDEELFKQPPPRGDCPICFLQLPTYLNTGWRYQACCGKVICSGCAHAPVYDNQGNVIAEDKCSFCRTPNPTSETEAMRRLKKRVGANNPLALFDIGRYHSNGVRGFEQDYTRALDFYHQASELGYAAAYLNTGYAYDQGRGVEVDKKKATHYYELAAIKGDEVSRYNLGLFEVRAGNYDRAIKHFMIAVSSGDAQSLIPIKELYSDGDASKDDYTKALQSYQAYLGEIKSKQRDEAAAAIDQNRYY